MMGPTTVAVMAAMMAQSVAVQSTDHVAALPGQTAFAAVPADPVSPAARRSPVRPVDVPVRGRVHGVEVLPGATGAIVLLGVDTAVSVRHFLLKSPTRIVVDLGPANLTVRPAYDGRTRGALRNVRLGQFTPDTVRLVLDLTSEQRYTVVREGGQLRIEIASTDSDFAAWSATTVPFVVADDAVPLAIPPSSAPGESTRSEAARSEAAAAAPPVDTPVVPRAGTLAEQTRRLAAEPVVAVAPRAVAASTPAAVDPSSEPMTPRSVRSTTTGSGAALRRQAQPKPRITVSYDGTNIRDVIAAFATFSGRTIVIGKSVDGLVTADIADKPWDVALQAILQSQGLAATEDASGIITVDSYERLAANQSLEPLVTQIIDINYAKAPALQTTVSALLARDCTSLSTQQTGRDLGVSATANSPLGSGAQGFGQGCVVRGSVTADSSTNKLIITEVPSRLPEIVARVQQLDIRTPQVAIKAKIIFVNRTGIQDIGLAYDLGTGNKQFFQQLVPRTDPQTLQPVDTDGDGVPDAQGGGTPFQGPARIALGGNAIAGIANANNAIKPNALNLIYSTALGRYQLTAFLNALQTSSLADVQSEPSITILNNRSAEIFVGQEIPIRVIDASAGGQGGGGGAAGGGAAGGAQQPNAATFFPRATVSKEEAGIKLSVTPQITNNRMVLMNIKAENSSAEVSATDVGVIFNRQRAESQVLVADGEAAVIGGLTVTETTRYRSGIPGLMNLPYIGRLFSQNSKNETKRDLLILVTPHILDEASAPPPSR